MTVDFEFDKWPKHADMTLDCQEFRDYDIKFLCYIKAIECWQ